ncbi:unnamed protein product [Cuscuta campestris]|uniref:Fibronectin type III-like domain-containing protein n=1 Tax=Cuscuta campestris TaxID=132261 RepID=A0A484KHE8_9ASTE|nr:unnamed protein product [Cuscuta campestris]
MNDMSMRADPSRGYPGRTYRFYTGDTVYKFGHGLSYTNFTLEFLSAPSRLSLSTRSSVTKFRSILNLRGNEPQFVLVDEVLNCELLSFSVKISLTNDGDMDGSCVVMLFSRVSSRVIEGAPQKQLIGFDRVHVSANETAETSIFINPCEHLSFGNEEGKRILPLGDHTLVLEGIEHVISIEI